MKHTLHHITNRLADWRQQGWQFLRLVRWTLNLLWNSHRWATIGVAFFTLCQALVPVGQLWLTKLLIDQLQEVLKPETTSSPEALQWVWWLVTYEVVLLLSGVLIGLLAGHLRNILQEHLVYQMQIKMLSQSARLDLAVFESPQYYNQRNLAQQEAMYGPIRLLSAILDLAQAAFSLLSTAALIFFYHFWVTLILVLTTIPSFGLMLYYSRQRYMLFSKRTPDGRRAEYLTEVLSSDVYAKEIRVWGLSDYLMQQLKDLRTRFRQENIDLSRRQALAGLAGEILSTAGYYSAYLTVVAALLNRMLTLGDMMLYAGLFTRAQNLFETMLHAIAEIYEIQLFATQLEAFLELEPTIVAPAQPQPIPAMTQGLTIQNLTFTYPGTNHRVLDNLNFTIQPGQCVAIVGVNGAGKTSLVKLLLRLYDPDRGAILADGCDLRRFDPYAWRQQIGVVFQDYARYQLSAQENVGFGNLAWLHDQERIRRAAQQAGIDDVLSHLPQGYASGLGRRFDGGSELSLGQWQRVALARALLREAPLLILDEPTAAIDAQAEYEIFQQFRQLAQGRMTLLISHRFSTVRMADLILVLDDGKIIEQGTHEQLLAQRGHYAHLFTLQAESYQLSTPETDPISFAFSDLLVGKQSTCGLSVQHN